MVLRKQLKRNQMKLIILFLVILLIPTIFAVEVSINNNPVKIKINNNTLEITSQYGINNKNITFNLVHSNITISTNETNITTDLCFIPSQEFTFDNYYLQNTSAFIDLDVNKRLIDCEIEKGLSKQNTTNCLNDLGSCKTENSTNLRNDLNSCNMSLAIKTMETQKSKEDSDRLILETDVKKNEKYTWGIGGLILGVLAILLYLGKIGKGTVKDRSVDEFNRQSVG